MNNTKRFRMYLLIFLTTIAVLTVAPGVSRGAELEVRAYQLQRGAEQLVHPDPDRASRLTIQADKGGARGRINIFVGFAKHKKLVGGLDFDLMPGESQTYEFEQELRIGLFEFTVAKGPVAVRVEQPAQRGVYPQAWAQTPANHLDIFPDAQTPGEGGESESEDQGIKNAVLLAYGQPGWVIAHAGAAVKFMQIGDRPAPPSALFNIVPGLADGSQVSVESCNRPQHFLKVDGNEVLFQKYEDDAQFREEATFKLVPGLADPTFASFESFAQSGGFLQKSGDRLVVKPAADDASRRAGTFQVKQAK